MITNIEELETKVFSLEKGVKILQFQTGKWRQEEVDKTWTRWKENSKNIMREAKRDHFNKKVKVRGQAKKGAGRMPWH